MKIRSVLKIGWLIVCLGLLTGCELDMRRQPRYEPFEKSAFFGDNLSARPRIADTVAHSPLEIDDHLYKGQIKGEFAETFPFTITLEVLERGQEQYNAFCAPCHSRLGDGQGIIVKYGLKAPPSFHIQRLREDPPGYLFDIITHGTRIMPSYGSRIPPEDRWAIIAYIRALQLSQNADLSAVPADEIPNLGKTEEKTK